MEWESVRSIGGKVFYALLMGTLAYGISVIANYSDVKRTVDEDHAALAQVKEDIRDLNLMRANIDALKDANSDKESRIRALERFVYSNENYDRRNNR